MQGIRWAGEGEEMGWNTGEEDAGGTVRELSRVPDGSDGMSKG